MKVFFNCIKKHPLGIEIIIRKKEESEGFSYKNRQSIERHYLLFLTLIYEQIK